MWITVTTSKEIEIPISKKRETERLEKGAYCLAAQRKITRIRKYCYFQDKIVDILVTTIFILYRKYIRILYRLLSRISWQYNTISRLILLCHTALREVRTAWRLEQESPGIEYFVIFKTRQDSWYSCHHNLDIVSKMYGKIVSIIVLNIETRQCNIKINLAISCSPSI